ncbi:MAG: TIGR00730 family Rossman fold protein [Myxococcota bacterium]
MTDLRRLAVYCGSSNRVSPAYLTLAYTLGAELATRGIGVVYGGGSVGLMNEVAQGAMDKGGEVIGVITERLLALEVARHDLTELHVVKGMHARKLKMCDLSDAFVALPGGYGTLDELFEAVTWTQLNVHHKPVALLDIDGFFEHLVSFLDHAAGEGFIRPPHRSLIGRYTSIDALLAGLKSAEIPVFGKWVAEP